MKRIKLLLIIVIMAILLIYFMHIINSHNIIESRLKIRLPHNSKVEKFSYNIIDGCFYSKISLNSKDIINIEDQLSNNFANRENDKFTDQINFDDCKWWDMDNNNVIKFYNKSIGYSKKSHKTRDIWVFITKEINGKYCLYISY